MKKIILIMALMASTGYAKTQYRYTPKVNKNFFSLLIGFGPTGMGYDMKKQYDRKEGLIVELKSEIGLVFGAQYTRMFNKTYGGTLGFMSNNSAFAATTIGW